MTKLLQRAGQFAGPEFSVDLDAIVRSNNLILLHFTDLWSLQIDSGRKQARRVDASGVRNAIAQWPCIEWDPAHPGIHFYLLGFNHNTSGRLLCPITLNWDVARYVFFHQLGLYIHIFLVFVRNFVVPHMKSLLMTSLPFSGQPECLKLMTLIRVSCEASYFSR